MSVNPLGDLFDQSSGSIEGVQASEKPMDHVRAMNLIDTDSRLCEPVCVCKSFIPERVGLHRDHHRNWQVGKIRGS